MRKILTNIVSFKRSSENASKFYQAAIEVFAERVEKGEKVFPATNPIRLSNRNLDFEC